MPKNQFDFYEILGVERSVSPEELRKAYLALAVRHHPDRNPGDPEAEARFKEISQAYATLSDPSQKDRYDRLNPPRQSERTRPEPGPETGGRSAGWSETAWASYKARERAESGWDRAEAASRGDGRRPGPESRDGRDRAGKGWSGGPSFASVLDDFFKGPKGRETLKDLEEELSQADPNFKPGDFSRWFENLSRQSKAEHSGEAGGAGLAPSRVERRPSLFRRLVNKFMGWGQGGEEGPEDDLSYQLSLSQSAARSGATIEISYNIDGRSRRLSVKVPPGLKSGTKLRLKGQGRPRPGQGDGDLILTISVVGN